MQSADNFKTIMTYTGACKMKYLLVRDEPNHCVLRLDRENILWVCRSMYIEDNFLTLQYYSCLHFYPAECPSLNGQLLIVTLCTLAL
jgi:hypothetical protein